LESGKINPILVGNPGVGKTMIIEGVAERMTSEDVPEVLQDKRLVSLSVASLVSGAGKIGELEERLEVILNEIERAGNIVLYIDNIHNMIGVSSGSGETLDLSEILAHYLQQARFFVIASTDPINYRHYIERKGALTTTFQKVEILEPETNNAIRILEGKAGGIEYRHKVFFSYEAIEKAVTLSQRYIHDRYLPEKAINLLEEVAIFVKRVKGKDAMVSGEDVAKIVSEKAKVKVTKITEKESETLLNLEDRIHERIIDQEEAVKAVASALRRARTELRDVDRPIANLLFLGPTGVGKTELAKTVAEVYFGSEKNMIRLDMSEYQTPSSINRLIGSAPGYGQEAGYLTEAVRQNPFSLILLDELEKAHPDVLNVFLQVMDDGRLTDGTGRTIDFTNAILIATSNAGTQLIQDRMRENKSIEEIAQELMTSALSQYFRPEFLNRFDKIVVFKPLSQENIEEIVKLLLEKVGERLLLKGITLQASDEAIKELAAEGFDPIYGARPLRRLISEKVDDALAKFLLTGKLTRRDIAVLGPGGTIRVEKAREL
jgi:ATP-dependent Clp protease ATP-binding subunit ClpC